MYAVARFFWFLERKICWKDRRSAGVAVCFRGHMTFCLMNRSCLKKSTTPGVLVILVAFASQLALSAENGKTNSIMLKYQEPRVLTGRIYAGVNAGAGNGKNVLFHFRRRAIRTGETLHVLREYMHPDGKPAARERVVYEGDNLVSYELEELQTGARGRADIRRDTAVFAKGRIRFEYSKIAGLDAKPKVASESLQKNTLVNDMVGPFLASHWDALVSEQTVKCRYTVVPRMETVGFGFRKEAESKWEGRKVIVIKMAATSPVIAALVDPLFFTMEMNAPHRVLAYAGRTTPKIKSGGKWKDLDAFTVFDWDQAK